jgi:hypothetical protein
VFIFREGYHAIPNIAGRENVEIFPKTSGGAAIVRDGYHSNQLAYRMRGRAQRIFGCYLYAGASTPISYWDILLESTQQGR